MSYTPPPVKENSIWAILVVVFFMSMAIGLFAFGFSKKPAEGVEHIFSVEERRAPIETKDLTNTNGKANNRSKNSKLAEFEVK